MVRAVATATAQRVPIANWVQVMGRIAPSEIMTISIGMSRKCVNVGRCSCLARLSSMVEAPCANASFVEAAHRSWGHQKSGG